MNREIEFRAWDESNKIMHCDFQFIKSGNTGSDWIVFLSDKQTDYEIAIKNPYFSQQLKIMQYIGLKDKNGKKIFEGDIVKAWVDSGPAGELEIIYTVEITPHGSNLQEWTFKEKGYMPEIIGNIYDNPELLERK